MSQHGDRPLFLCRPLMDISAAPISLLNMLVILKKVVESYYPANNASMPLFPAIYYIDPCDDKPVLVVTAVEEIVPPIEGNKEEEVWIMEYFHSVCCPVGLLVG